LERLGTKRKLFFKTKWPDECRGHFEKMGRRNPVKELFSCPGLFILFPAKQEKE